MRTDLAETDGAGLVYIANSRNLYQLFGSQVKDKLGNSNLWILRFRIPGCHVSFASLGITNAGYRIGTHTGKQLVAFIDEEDIARAGDFRMLGVGTNSHSSVRLD